MIHSVGDASVVDEYSRENTDISIMDTVESTRIEPFLGENRVILD